MIHQHQALMSSLDRIEDTNLLLLVISSNRHLVVETHLLARVTVIRLPVIKSIVMIRLRLNTSSNHEGEGWRNDCWGGVGSLLVILL